MKTIECDNITYKIGQNASENWKILDESNKDDVFFHLKSFPSCYVRLIIAKYQMLVKQIN